MDLAYALAGLVVGTAVGATGVGGGSLMTPILILFYNVVPAVAVGTDLLYASISKAFGVFLHGRRGTVDWSIVGWLALGSVPASGLALLFIHHLGNSASLDHMIKLTLSIAIVVTALFTLCQTWILCALKACFGSADEATMARLQRPLTVVCGVLIGALVTISSVGAGVIGMMLLLLIYPKVTPIRLVGADLAHAVLITGIAGLGHARLGTVHYGMLVSLLIGALPGIWIGTRVGFKLGDVALKRLISGLMVIIGSTMMARALASGL